MRVERVLSFDVGKTGCRAVLFDRGTRVASGTSAGPAGLVDQGGPAAAVEAMAAAVRGLDVPAPRVDVISVGLAGFAQLADQPADQPADPGAGPGADRLAAAVLAHPDLDVGARRVALASDMTTSHAGALAGRPGVVVAAGTGAVTLCVDASGRHHVVDGWGYLLGDAGSGYAVGRAGLDSALRAHDGRGGSAALLTLGRDRFGDPDTWPSVVHGSPNPAGTVAAFARDVLTAAEQGDETSRVLWGRAGEALADAVGAAVRRTPGTVEVEVATTGGLLDAGELVREPFRRALAERMPRARLVPRAGDAHDGAFLLATRHDLPHEPLVRRTEGPTP